MSQAQPNYDLLLQGGRVIDAKNGINAIRDVAIKDGKVAAVEPRIDPATAVKAVNVAGLYVTPGLIDIHVHVFAGTGERESYAGDHSVYPDGFTFRVGVTSEGLANLPAGQAVYAANHGSALDIPILFGHLPVDFRIIHKRSLYLLPVLGWSLYLAGHIGIDRGNAFRARKSLDAAAVRIRAGTSVATFPEGTRSPDAEVWPFKRGSFVMALQAQVPVVPMSLAGVKRVAPRGILTLRPGTVQLKIHPPIATAGLHAEAAESLAAEVRRVVAAGCAEAA
jgi:1-acyl-sn-glycerol-3-phosphate acyltransferase